MSSPTDKYARLIRATGAKDSVPAVIWSLTENGAAWAALVTLSGQPMMSATRDSVDQVDPDLVAEVFAAIPKPITKTAVVHRPDGIEVTSFPVGAEKRPSVVLLIAAEDPVDPDLIRYGGSAAHLIGMIRRYRRQIQTASRTVRDSVTRLLLANQTSAGLYLAAEMGLAAPPTHPYLACVSGLSGWEGDDLLDVLEAGLPVPIRQFLAEIDPDECWMILNHVQFRALEPELRELARRNEHLSVLLAERLPIEKLSQRWHHYAATLRSAPAGSWLDLRQPQADNSADLVEKLQQASPQVLEAVVEYLRHRGRWETAAESLSVHRNTLRYRVAAAEKLLGVDLADPTVSSYLWLALLKDGLIGEPVAADSGPPAWMHDMADG